MPLGARSVALGRAVVADTSPDMLVSNPAGIAGLHRAALLVHYRKLPLDNQVLGVVFVSRPAKFGTFAVAYTLMDGGSLTLTGKEGQDNGTSFIQFHTLAAAFATHLTSDLTGGLVYKLYRQQVPCGAQCDTKGGSGTTQLVDAGMQYRPHWSRRLALGGAVTNAGIPLQIVNFEQSDEPPTRVRAGASYEVLHLFQRDSTLTGSVEAQLEYGKASGPVPAIGAEVTIGDVLALRAGWRSQGRPTNTYGGDLDTGVTLGVGIKFQRFSLAVARAMDAGALDTSPFQITFGMSF